MNIEGKCLLCLIPDKPVVSFTSSENLPNVPIGTTVLLTCDVNSVPIAQVTLKQDNVLLKSKEGSLSHTFTLQRSSSGMYTCTAKNFEGTSEVKKIVTVQGIILKIIY